MASPGAPAPLLRSVPFYTVIANHDVQGKDERGHEVADFTRNPDALAEDGDIGGVVLEW